MNIIINGEEKTLNTPMSMTDLLHNQGFGDMTVAIARNGKFVPKSDHSNVSIEDGDQIEIVAPMQGG